MTAANLTTNIRAREVGFLHDLRAVATRGLTLIPRDVEGVVPALIIPIFFFIVNVGSLQEIAESQAPGFDYKAFQLPVAIIFAVTGISRAPNLVTDIQDGYFDRMVVTPMNRVAFLLGLMVADLVLVIALSIPVVTLGLLLGVSFEAGPLGIVAFILIAALWGVVFTGFPYAIALKTGSPAAVNSSFLLFFPFAFLTTAFVPEEALTGWLAAIAKYNPVTYILEALRSLIFVGWDASELAKGFAAIIGVGIVSQFLAFAALRGRLRQG
ncbi:MAG: ABC transporter permease [Actinomycetota bacterium]|nr:ABC transporter permease [Actinomycetota bacterium]